MCLLLIEIQIQSLVHLSENTQAECISLEATRAREGSKCLILFPAMLATSCVNLGKPCWSLTFLLCKMEIQLVNIKRDGKMPIYLQNVTKVRIELIRVLLWKLLNFSWLQCHTCQNRNKYLSWGLAWSLKSLIKCKWRILLSLAISSSGDSNVSVMAVSLGTIRKALLSTHSNIFPNLGLQMPAGSLSYLR